MSARYNIQWLIIIACCITVIESVYQLTLIAKFYPKSSRSCTNDEKVLGEAFGSYQFQYIDECAKFNRTFKEFFAPEALAAADEHVRAFIEAMDRTGGRKLIHIGRMFVHIHLIWIILNTLHIGASLFLYWAGYATNAWSRRLMLNTVVPWSVVTVLVALSDILMITMALTIYYTCRNPSTCVMWKHCNPFSPQQPQFEEFDKYAKPGDQLYDCITYMPQRFVVIALKHVIGSPILILILVFMVVEYRRRNAEQTIKTQ